MRRIFGSRKRIISICTIIGLVCCIVALRIFVSGASQDRFTRIVGWANILALIVAVLAIVAAFISGIHTPEDRSPAVLDEKAQTIAEQLRTSENRELRRLIGGDALAEVKFSVKPSRQLEDSGLLSRLRELVKFSDPSGNQIGDISTLNNYFDSLSTPRLAILGPPGAGKTIMLISLAIQMLRTPQANKTVVPIRANLADYDPLKQDLASWIAGQISFRYRISDAIAKRLVDTGRIMPLLDGLDEMDDTSKAERAAATIKQVSSFVAGQELGIVIACREFEWHRIDSQLIALIGTSIVHVQPLDSQQIRRYVSARLNTSQQSVDPWEPLFSIIEQASTSFLSETLRTPLWLYLAVVSFQADPKKLLTASDSRSLKAMLLAGFIPTIIESLPRGRRRKTTFYEEDDVRRWLREIAQFFENPSTGQGVAADIIPDQLWRIAGRGKVILLHATVIFSLALISFLSIWSGVKQFAKPLEPDMRSSDYTLIIWVVVLAGILIFQAIRTIVDTTEPPLYIKVNIKRARLSSLSVRLAFLWLGRTLKQSYTQNYRGFIFGAIIFELPIIVSAIARTSVSVLIPGSILLTAALYIIFGTTNFLITLILAPTRALIQLVPAEARRPYDGLRYDRLAGLTIVALFLIFKLATPPTNWSSLLYTVIFGFMASSLACRASLRYALAVGIKARSGSLPIALKDFFAWAVEGGLLREAGPAYQFRHIELQRWLAEVDD